MDIEESRHEPTFQNNMPKQDIECKVATAFYAVTFVMSAVLICTWTLSHYDDDDDDEQKIKN